MIGLLFSGIISRLTTAFRWATSNPMPSLIAILALVAFWQHHERVKAERVLASTEAAYSRAQDQAKAAQIAAIQATEARYRAKAEETDDKYQTALDGAHRASARYIAANRLRSCDTGQARRSAPTAESESTESAARSGDAANMVAVTAQDINVCTTNTERLQAAHDWAVGLDR